MNKKIEIIEPGIENISGLPLWERIERAGKVCYRSEHTITEGSALRFAERIAKSHHYSVLGHGQILVSLHVDDAVDLDISCPLHLRSHLQSMMLDGDRVLMAAGVDTWFQLFEEYPSPVLMAFAESFPLFSLLVTDDYQLTYKGTEHEVLFACEESLDLPLEDFLYLVKETFIITTDRATAMQLRTYRYAAHSVMSQRYVNFEKYGFRYIKPDGVDLDFWLSMKEREVDGYLQWLEKGYKPEIARSSLGSDIESTMATTASLWEWRHILRLRLDPAAQPAIQKIAGMIKENLEEKYGGLFVV